MQVGSFAPVLWPCKHALVSNDGLSKREISWLLAQEARTAAQALRQGIEIQVRDTSPPPRPGSAAKASPLSTPVLDSLATLDEAMNLLGDLQHHKGSRRRGRLDVTALLYEVAPDVNINLHTTSGTEIFGDEDGVRRMLQLLLTQAGGQSPARSLGLGVNIRREGQFVHIQAELGPDASNHSALERRWLNRMAVRAGGSLQMTGRAHTLVLPADGAAREKELEELRDELSQAQELGEAYARELATVFTSAEAAASMPAPEEPSRAQWEGMHALNAATRLFLRATTRRLGASSTLPALALDSIVSLNPPRAGESLAGTSPQALQNTLSLSQCLNDRELSFEPLAQEATTVEPGGLTSCLCSWLLEEAAFQSTPDTPLRLGVEKEADFFTICAVYTPDAMIWDDHAYLSDAPPSISQGRPRPLGVAGTLLRALAKDSNIDFGQQVANDGPYSLWIRLSKL